MYNDHDLLSYIIDVYNFEMFTQLKAFKRMYQALNYFDSEENDLYLKSDFPFSASNIVQLVEREIGYTKGRQSKGSTKGLPYMSMEDWSEPSLP